MPPALRQAGAAGIIKVPGGTQAVCATDAADNVFYSQPVAAGGTGNVPYILIACFSVLDNRVLSSIEQPANDKAKRMCRVQILACAF